MFFVHLLFALVFALLLSLIFVAAFRTRGPWQNLLLFFIIIFLASWAGGIWLSPVGPALWGVYWIPFLLVGLIFAFLLAAAVVPGPPESTVELVDQREKDSERKVVLTGLSVFF